MKLHLGCGSVYLPGYVNSDPYSSAVADAAYPAWRLPCDDGCVEEIVSSQLLEHLGRIPAAFAASEWYRVLQDGGMLALETVDLEGTLADSPLDRNWLCGVDAPGMLHSYCFPEAELRGTLAAAGFEAAKITRTRFQNKPVLRIEARKRTSLPHLLVARLRRRWLDAKLLHLPLRRPEDSAFEDLIEPLRRLLSEAEPGKLDVAAMLGLLAAFQPKAAEIFFSALLEEPRLSERHADLKRAQAAARALDERQLHAHLAHLFSRLPKPAGNGQIVYRRVLETAQRYAAALYHGEEKAVLLPLQLQIWSEPTLPPLLRKLRHFSPPALTSLSEHCEVNGIKRFAVGRHQQAAKLLRDAVAYNPDNCFAYWNLARLQLMRAETPQAIIDYERALEVVPAPLREELIQEIRDVTRGETTAPYREAKQHVHY